MFVIIAYLFLLFFLPPGWISAWTWEEGLRWLYLFLIAFFTSHLLSPIAFRLAGVIGAIDIPDKRKMHTVPTPRLGGLAVYLAVVFTIVRNQQFSYELLGLLAGGSIIFILGVVEDSKGLSPYSRLFWQAAAAGIVIYSGIRFHFPNHWLGGELISVILTFLWLIGMANVVNMMDGIDGLVCGTGMVCSIFFTGIAWNAKQKQLAYLASSLGGACLGFMPSNWNPAKMFLGDCGSTFIGFMLGGMAVFGGWAENNPLVALSTPLLILGIPIFDAVYITISRIRRGVVRSIGEWLEYTGKDHFHHRLVHLGLNVKESVGFIILVNICLGLGAWTMHYTKSRLGTGLLLLQSLLIFCIIVVLMLLGRDVKDENPSLKI